MISSQELDKISRERIKDARVLFKNKSYDGSLYMCGYAIELALKAIICKNLCLSGIPHTSEEFSNIARIKTHNLEELLKQTPTQISTKIKSVYFADWSIILQWNPEMRYAPIKGKQLKNQANGAINSAQHIVKYLWKEIK
ncbi:MAG: HEPN domain-containing protein [Candidatus Paceibacterota bacterium]